MRTVFALVITMLLGAGLIIAQGGGSNTAKVDPAKKAVNDSKKGSGMPVAGAKRRPSPGGAGANSASQNNKPSPTPTPSRSPAK